MCIDRKQDTLKLVLGGVRIDVLLLVFMSRLNKTRSVVFFYNIIYSLYSEWSVFTDYSEYLRPTVFILTVSQNYSKYTVHYNMLYEVKHAYA